MKKEYKSDDFICPKVQIEKMKKKKKIRRKQKRILIFTKLKYVLEKQQNMKGILILYLMVRQS